MTVPVTMDQPREGVTVLVAEDDPDLSDLVRHLLRAEGYRVEVATDGEEALSGSGSAARIS